ncbi:MAG: cytidylate kinase-like family protein [Pirellulales bacterium]|nr:cytidylate kinase-like family protein [Pirellulales bacterium]
MNSFALLGRISEVLDHVNHFWETHPLPAPSGAAVADAVPPSVVAIDREVGTPDEEISREVGSRLDWPVYDHELLEIVARRANWPLYAIEELDERHVPWLQESFETFWAFPGVREAEFVRQLVHTIVELGSRGQCVIVGRAASYILPTEGALRVRLVAARQDRVATVARRLQVSTSEAARRIRVLERARSDFLRSHFRSAATGIGDSALVLNTSHLSVRECSDLIVEALRRRRASSDTLCGTTNATERSAIRLLA